MRNFQQIYDIAADRKGGFDSIEEQISKPKPAAELAAIPDDRWLSDMTKRVFQAGFNWKVVEKHVARFRRSL